MTSDPDGPSGSRESGPEYGGYCARCGRYHRISWEEAAVPARELMELFRLHGRLDWTVPEEEADPRCSLEPLYGRARGQMFGVLVCRDSRGQRQVLRAFSGQYGGLWEIPGWVPPVADPAAFARLVEEPDREIKALGRRLEELAGLPEAESEIRHIREQRRELSRKLMGEIHRLYRLTSFRGESRNLTELFPRGIPAGTGDCCAPKLIHRAALLSWKPLSMAEFFWGRDTLSGGRTQGTFYSSCREKCGPLLGFMLCGAEQLRGAEEM